MTPRINQQSKWMVVILSLTSILSHNVCQGCSRDSSDDEYRVVRRTDSDGKQLVVAVGDDARLSCQTNVPWKTCVWKPPRNGVRELKCEFGRKKVEHMTCPSFPEIHFDKERSAGQSCTIVVHQITEHHEGNWGCELEIDVPTLQEKVIVKDKVRLMARGWRYP
ncbi:hypothetical protein TCAL_12390 [Tigriopus californicus]|uniref:Immunoglobulin subtype domain-containing protein n=1 Tax=Tigriopus californicus TaxID=6832 RepID=A0A553PN74_TIGCA|nr:uncharacterized protein LOC131882362 [Tigriopus californicus]TRY79127.1 hypothetical protein TCAL_12390 [Tigriopus californicus]|eukprot:TCALIF_12390-PA protein Name:"Protein of unknown function" AED:0.18 eAED:0.18 QI:188/1/1/1/0.25/0/5/301/163